MGAAQRHAGTIAGSGTNAARRSDAVDYVSRPGTRDLSEFIRAAGVWERVRLKHVGVMSAPVAAYVLVGV